MARNSSQNQPTNGTVKDDPLLTFSEVAQMFNVHRATVMRWVDAKALPSVPTPGGPRKVRKSHVEAIIGVANSTP